MKKLNLLFIIFLLASVSQSAFSQQDNFLKEYLQRWENSRKYLIAVAEAMPDSNYSFKSAPSEMTFAEQLMHIALGVDWQGQTLIGGRKEGAQIDFYKVGNRSKQDIIKVINTTFEDAARLIMKFDPAHYEDTLDYVGLSRTKRQILMILTDHVTHHRGQLIVYMRIKGVAPPEYVKFQ